VLPPPPSLPRTIRTTLTKANQEHKPLDRGTARGFSDTWAVGATQEVIVGACAGTFDGTPTHGMVAMDSRSALLHSRATRSALTCPAAVPASDACHRTSSNARPWPVFLPDVPIAGYRF
jgi:membrane carboxypeptidase/penicillin-binding protein PbpC